MRTRFFSDQTPSLSRGSAMHRHQRQARTVDFSLLVRSVAFFSMFAGAVFCAVGGVSVAQADDAVDPAVEKQLRTRFGSPEIGLDVLSVESSEMAGIYRVQLKQGPVVYATENGDHFVLGDLYSTGPSGLVNIAETRRSESRKAAVDDVPMSQKIVFSADNPAKTHITVFTDVSCFYCQKLHKEVPQLNSMGVEVRYLAYPREGIGSPGFRQLASAWCADDRQATLTRLKNREELEENVCPGNPVAEQFELGQQLGVRGTPAIVMPNGELLPGYRSAEDLAGLLDVQ